jgi:FMN phosphatase YigB (HAD superfamily)/uncharacterized damage-inducible protein DinB
MSLTVLFDLDDTLLRTNMGAFLPGYFTGLANAYADLGSEKTILKANSDAVQAMIGNRDPARSLKQAFDRTFYPALGTTAADCQARNEAFYRKAFPTYQSLTERKPEAAALIAWCLSQGFTLAIATNPFFPKEATLQRVHWAGLNPADFQYFSTYEDFHFTKPSIAYYAECLGRLGWPDGPIVMVGDTLTHDLLPMEALGFPTFWITDEPLPPDRAGGSLAEVQPWLTEQQHKDIQLTESYDAQEATLRSSPAVLDGWLKTLPEERFQRRPAPDEWSLTEIFWHLADMEKEVYLPQWQQLSRKVAQPITPPDTSEWAEARDYQSRPPKEALNQFYQARMDSLALIQSLADDGRMGETFRHAIFSKLTIAEMLQFSAKHDRIHLCQCFALINDNI